MRKSIDLNTLSVSQLTKLQAEIPGTIKRKTQDAQEAFKAKLAKMAESEGYDPYKLFGAQPVTAQPVKNGAQKSSKVAIKYRDAKNPANTWTGRGRQPRWLAALTKAGHKLDEYRVGA